MMQKSELEIRYRSKVAFWYKSFEGLSTEIDLLQVELERQRKIVEKVGSQNTQLIIELKDLQQQKEEMSFSDVALQ